MEPLVVVPPDVPVDVRAQLFHARVDVVVNEFLLDETVGGFHHRVVVRAAGPGKGTRDTERGEHALHPFAGECGQHEVGVMPDSHGTAGDLAVGQVAGQADVRP